MALIGQTRCAETGVHRQRVNVLGALDQRGKLLWTVKEQHTVREDVMAFFDSIAEQPHSVPRIVVLDNANIHRGEAMEQKRRQWQQRALLLSTAVQPGTEPHRNPVETGQVFWRKFVRLTAGTLVDEVNSLMTYYGTEFTINFR